MKKLFVVIAILAMSLLTGCERLETGEVGLRQDFNKTINQTELYPGSFNQTLIGSVLVFQTKQIALQLTGLQPQTSDHSTLADLDITVIYNISPTAVYDLYTTKAHAFNATSEKGDVFLMYNYMTTIANSAAYKAASKVTALDATSSRAQIEADTVAFMRQALKDEGLEGKIVVDQAQVKKVLPAQSIIESANAVINQTNALRAKQIEVDIAQKEAARLAMLSSNQQNIAYMKVKALADIAEGVKDGKVKTVIVPWDFKGMLNVSD